MHAVRVLHGIELAITNESADPSEAFNEGIIERFVERHLIALNQLKADGTRE
jgi:hypothetical protein